jgi:choline-glycine betaine transporter
LVFLGKVFKTDGFSLRLLSFVCASGFIVDRFVLILLSFLGYLDEIILISNIVVPLVVVAIAVGVTIVFVVRMTGLEQGLVVLSHGNGVICLLDIAEFLCAGHAELVLDLVDDAALLPYCFVGL